MPSDADIAATLSSPGDRLGWEKLLRSENDRITSYLVGLAARYGISDDGVADIKQTALIRIVSESRRIKDAKSYWPYWVQILRSSFFDHLRAERNPALALDESMAKDVVSKEALPDTSAAVSEAWTLLSGRSLLTRHVANGMALGESAEETARRTGSTAETVYVIRGRIRAYFKKL